MSLINYFSSLSSGSVTPTPEATYQNNYYGTAINGDLDPTALDQLQLFGINGLQFKDDIGYLWYTGNGQSNGTEDVDLIFLATKDMTDGLPINEGWTKTGTPATSLIPAVPGTWISYQLFSMSTFWDVDHWKMYVTGDDRTGETKFRAGLFTSTDGLSWTENINNPLYENFTDFAVTGSTFFVVYKEHSTLYHAFAFASELIHLYGVTYLTSTDGITWVQQGEDLFNSTNVRQIYNINKIGSKYYMLCGYGFDTDFHAARQGIATNITMYSTEDFIDMTFEFNIYERDKPSESGPGALSIAQYGDNWYIAYCYNKYQIKNAFSGGEPYAAIRFIERDGNFTTELTNTKQYPSYLKRYYPLYQQDESQTPIERIIGDAPLSVSSTLAWPTLKYCVFGGSLVITYPEYVPLDKTKFAVKVRSSVPVTGSHQIIRQHFDNGNFGWSLLIVEKKLRVQLFNGVATLVKQYTTVDDIVKPPGVYDQENDVSIGFIFNSGTLDLLFGDGIQTVTKDTDNPITEIETGGNIVSIGTGSINRMRSHCIFDEITEDQWLNVIDL